MPSFYGFEVPSMSVIPWSSPRGLRPAVKILGIRLETLYNRLNDYDRFARTSGSSTE